MNWFKNRKTITKLMVGFGFLALLIAFVGYRGITGMSTINDMLDTMYNRDMTGLSAIKEANINLIYVGRAMRAAVLNNHKTELDRIEQHSRNVDKYLAAVASNPDAAENTIVTEKGKAEIAKLKSGLAEYQRHGRGVMSMALEGNDEGAQLLITKIRALADQMDNGMTEIANMKEGLSKKAYEDAAATFQQ